MPIPMRSGASAICFLSYVALQRGPSFTHLCVSSAHFRAAVPLSRGQTTRCCGLSGEVTLDTLLLQPCDLLLSTLLGRKSPGQRPIEKLTFCEWSKCLERIYRSVQNCLVRHRLSPRPTLFQSLRFPTPARMRCFLAMRRNT